MIEINLLPWREQARQRHKRDFGFMLTFSALIGVVILVIIYFPFANELSIQKQRSSYLRERYIKQNQEMMLFRKTLKEKEEIVTKINVIQNLQSDHYRVVGFLDLLARSVPKGAYLTKVERNESEIQISGMAQTNYAITQLIKSLNKSTTFKRVSLDEIKQKEDVNTNEKSFIIKLEMVGDYEV